MTIVINGTTGISGVDGSAATPAVQGADTNTGVFYPAADTVGLATNGAERMRVDSSGNVGIGTTSPSYRLDVSGAATATPVTNGIIRILTTGSNPPTGYGGGLVFSQVDSSAVNRDYASITGSRVNSSANNQVDMVFSTGDPGGGSIPVAERMRLTTAGNLLVGTTSTSGRLSVQGADSLETANAIKVVNSSGTTLLQITNLGSFLTGNATNSPYNNTTANAANVNIASSGQLYRSTSSIKYKTNVQNATHGLAEVMTLRPVTYKGKNDGETVFGGLIAEEVEAAGLTEFVQYAEDGTPDALAYGNMVSLCIKAIQEQQALITSLTARIEALENK